MDFLINLLKESQLKTDIMINIQKCLSVRGHGSSAVVKEAFERRTHKHVAVKMIRKEKRPRNKSEPDYLMKEIDIFKKS